MQAPTPEDVRRALAPLDVRRQKVVAGLVGLMIQNPGRIREREWIARELTELVVLAGDFEAASPEGAVREVHRFLRENGEELLTAALLLFQRVGLDLAPRAESGFTLDEALRAALAYLPDLGSG